MVWPRLGPHHSDGFWGPQMRNTGRVQGNSASPTLAAHSHHSLHGLLPVRPLPAPQIFRPIKSHWGGKMVSTKALHKKVINANSSEEIASTDGNGPFATNAAGCADGDYGMYVNTQAPASRESCTTELNLHSGRPPWCWPCPGWPRAPVGSRGQGTA